MIEDIRDTDEDSFKRHWSERVWDRAQLAQIEAIEAAMVTYAMTAWRSMNIPPPKNQLILGAVDIGVVLLMQNDHGDWRDNLGTPHKPPRAWMPCPLPPKTNGRGT